MGAYIRLMIEDREEIGKKLSEVRKLHGHTLEHLARRLGVTKSYLSKIENGHKAVPYALLRKFAEVYSASHAFSARIGGHINIKTNEGERNEMKDELQTVAPNLQVNLDPVRTPILYSDWQNVTSNDGGVVINFAQSAAPMPAQHIVARIGLSHAQAKELYRVLGDNLKNFYKSKDLEF